MVELYALAPEIRILLASALTIAIGFQTLRLFLMLAHKEIEVPRAVIYHEAGLLVHLALGVLLVALTVLQRSVIGGYLFSLRYFDVLLVCICLYVAWRHRRKEPLVCALFLLPILPIYSVPYSQYFFLVSSLYFIFRSGLLLVVEWKKVKNSISRLSMKEAIDTFPGGILYADDRGRKVIENPSMNQLLSLLGVHSMTDVSQLWESLMRIQDSYDIRIQAIEDKLLIRIRNAGAWLFSNQVLLVKKKKYLQFLAMDVSDEDVLIQKMEEGNKTLEKLSANLSTAIKSSEQLEQEREILRMKARVHDILAQRLSLLGRLLESDLALEDILYKCKPLVTDLTQSITAAVDLSPQHMLDAVVDSCAMIGSTVHVEGSLPSVQQVAEVFSEVIRECATNAVHHGDAKYIHVELQENADNYSLKVENDGILPVKPIIEGTGITEMRRRIHAAGGTMETVCLPKFAVKVKVRKKRKDEGE